MLSEDEHLTKANNEITAAQAYVWHVVVAPPCVCVCNSCSICKIAAVFTAIAINLVIIRACVYVCGYNLSGRPFIWRYVLRHA